MSDEKEEITAIVPVKPKTFAELIGILVDADNAVMDISFEEMENVNNLLAEKVDSLEFILSKIAAEKDRLKSQIDRLSTAKTQLENKETQLKNYVKFAMEKNNFDQLKGKNYTIFFRKSESTNTFFDPDSSLFVKYPNFIDRKYSWKKAELKKALKEGNKEVSQFAEIVENKNINFKVRKEI